MQSEIEQIFVHVSMIHQTSFSRGTKYIAPKLVCNNIIKRNELKVYISLKENKLQVAKAHFRCTIWFIISGNKYHTR